MASLKKRLALIKDLGLTQASQLTNPAKEGRSGGRIVLEYEKSVGQALGAKRGQQSSSARQSSSTSPGTYPPGLGAGWRQIGQHCFTKSTLSSFAVGDKFLLTIDIRMFEKLSRAGLGFVSGDYAKDYRVELGTMTFFDLETTGLSGGSGTIAFLAGLGYFEAGNFVVDQVFIDDFPGEMDFLSTILSYLEIRPTVVSYNGKAFDIPLLRTRCIMNGLPVPHFQSLDLLHPARRLWSHALPSCSLQVLESAILDVERENDIPGAFIPQIWLDYVKNGASFLTDGLRSDEDYDYGYDYSCQNVAGPRMNNVLTHNEQDIVSLAKLFCTMISMVESSRQIGSADITSLSHMVAACGRIEAAIQLLEQAGINGDERALITLARYYRRGCYLGGRYPEEQYREKYRETVLRLNCITFDSCIEKAKYWEHMEKNYKAALEASQKAMMILDTEAEQQPSDKLLKLSRKKESVQKRISRLNERLQRNLK
ncbi:MAG TPA: ribonuclease H-like domain-containing protein [Spirochaetales bacterium]|nr:ribonuclease H-like domain-containing protein [Spirochaetales bacterium]